MPHERLFLPGAVALLLVLSGCAGLGVPTGATQDASPRGTVTDGTVAGAVESGGASTASLVATGNLSRLYHRTIDSVVQITVQTPRGTSQGSGFVYSDSGYIVTNQHVVGQASSVQVRFRTGSWRVAAVVGTDVYTDLAVLKVDSLPPGIDPLPVTRENPTPGQPVVALGSPYGYEGTITHGIVSGINRSMQTARGFSIPDTIQTDAPINPGNSGGPLVSLEGKVVGVNRAKRGDNIGFAISADVVRQVVPSLIENGTYRHSFIGVRVSPVTPRIANANDIDRAKGVMVVSILEGGPADGDLQPATIARTGAGYTVPVGGDIIVSIEGRQVLTQQALAQYLLLHTHPGETVTLTVLRDGERVTETITLGRRPELSVDRSV
ncbi:MAG: S1C family serine protease [Halodesulfurarchaeum sp.]